MPERFNYGRIIRIDEMIQLYYEHMAATWSEVVNIISYAISIDDNKVEVRPDDQGSLIHPFIRKSRMLWRI